MKQTQEFNGKNIDAAIEKACTELNVSKKQLVYDVISSGSTGIFGIVGVKKARIRVTLPEKKGGLEPSSSDAKDADLQGIMSIVDEAFGEEPPQPVTAPPGKKFKSVPPAAKKKPARKPAPRSNKKPNTPAVTPEKKSMENREGTPDLPEKPMTTDMIPPDAPEEVAPFHGDQSPPLKDAKKETTQAAAAPLAADQPQEDLPVDDPEPESEPEMDHTDIIDARDEGFPPKYIDEIAVDVSEAAMELGRETLQKMVDLITADAIVVALRDEDRLLLRVEGGNSGVLIGRRGQTLEAMQFITDKIINRFSESRVRLKVDIEGYMETRKDNLRTLAHKMADKAQKTGKPATINQMTAQDRRIVHLALKDDARVRTQSMGDGYYRRLVIFPKKRGYKKRRNIQK